MTQQTAAAAMAALALVATACVPAPPPLDDDPVVEHALDTTIPQAAATSVARQAQQITVRIRVLGCEHFGTGSGFVLPGGVVVTNRHVVQRPRAVTLNTWDGRSLEAEVRGIAIDSDLAVLRLVDDEPDLPTATLRDAPVELGEQVLAAGYPDGGPITVSTGRVVDRVDGEVLGEPADVLRVDARIRQGNSGGPLLDEQGRVVGVVFALEVPTGHGLAVPVEVLLDRLERGPLLAPTGAC